MQCQPFINVWITYFLLWDQLFDPVMPNYIREKEIEREKEERNRKKEKRKKWNINILHLLLEIMKEDGKLEKSK